MDNQRINHLYLSIKRLRARGWTWDSIAERYDMKVSELKEIIRCKS